jgi:thiopeptide-type bacteriocin biosynthesis protein
MDPLGFFYLRIPLLSLQEIIDLLDNDNLEAYLHNGRIREAIFLASPSFDSQLSADPLLTSSALRLTFLKYLLRMGSRSTPFGLFAGCSLGYLGSRSELDLANGRSWSAYSLDFRATWRLAQYLIDLPALRPLLKFLPNTSLYHLGNSIRYTEMTSDVDSPSFFTNELGRTKVLDLLFSRTSQGRTLEEIECSLTKRGYPLGEIRLLLSQLIDDQLLVSELEINVTGQDYLSRLVDLLGQSPDLVYTSQTFLELQCILSSELPPLEKQKSVQDFFKQHIYIPLENKPVIKVDSFLSVDSLQLHTGRVAELQKTFEKLFVLSAQYVELNPLERFKQVFYQRYEEEEIPLMRALDVEAGLNFDAYTSETTEDFIEQLVADYQSIDQTFSTFSRFDQWLQKLYLDWLESGSSILILSDENLASLPTPNNLIPDSYYTLGYFLASSTEAIDAGDFSFRAKAIAGPTAFHLLGRFTHLDSELEKIVKHTYSQQQANDPSKIYAEIVHLPNAQTGNVVQRSVLSDYEIPYLGYSTLPLDKQITVDDLMVSIPNGKRIILRSKRLGKEVIPRLTTAHSYQSGLPVYRFLCELQRQETSLSVNWHWGPLRQIRYLPRVQYRNVILHEARWRLEWQDYDLKLSNTNNVKLWRQRWQLPRYIALVQADQELLLDLESSICIQLLIDTLKRLHSISLIEWLRVPNQCCVKGKNGLLTHEVILPFIKKDLGIRHSLPTSTHIKKSNHRTFIPGSEWVYLKIYCGPKTTSAVITKLGKLARSFIKSHQISHWFFIRYQDPELHLRIRFRLISADSFTDFLAACHKQLANLVKSGEVHTVQLDTYKREIERYGSTQIETLEFCFWADSEAVLSFLQENIDKHTQFIISLFSIDSYLSAQDYSTQKKLELSEQCFQNLFDEHGSLKETKKQLAKKYRENEKLVSLILNGQITSILSKTHIDIVEKRNKVLAHLLNQQKQKPSNLISLIHLFVNRFYDQHQRTVELLIYHHLSRGYKSKQVCLSDSNSANAKFQHPS